MAEVKDRLAEDTKDWKSTGIRLITADEVAEISGAKDVLQWSSDKPYVTGTPTIGTNISHFYLDGASGTDASWHTKIASESVKSQYAWLYNYTYACIQRGCEIEDNNVYPYGADGTNTSAIGGYWTSDPALYYSSTAGANVSQEAWGVRYDGVLIHVNSKNESHMGVRPVITISKSILY